MSARLVLLFVSCLSSAGLAEEVEGVEPVELAQVEPADELYGDDYPVLDRVFDVMNGRALRPRTFFYVITHRNFETAFNDDWFYNYFGFDNGNLKVGLGLRYGIIENLDIGVYRLNGTVEPFDTYEFDARYQLLHRERHFVDLAVRLGGSWFAQRNHQALGGFAQLLGSTVVFERLTLGSGFLFHSDSTNGHKTRRDTKASAAIPLLLELRILGGLAAGFEMVDAVAGYKSKIPIFSVGPKLITHRHTFSLIYTNNQYITADGIVTNTPRGPKRWILGFNITREL